MVLAVNYLFSVISLAMLVFSIYLAGSHWRLLLPAHVVDFVLCTSFVQMFLNIFGIYGARKARDYHEVRGRNWYLFLYVLLLFTAIIVQGIQTSYTVDGARGLRQCYTEEDTPCVVLDVEYYARSYPGEWNKFEAENKCCGFDLNDYLSLDPSLNASCPVSSSSNISSLLTSVEMGYPDDFWSSSLLDVPVTEKVGCRQAIVSVAFMFMLILNAVCILVVTAQSMTFFGAVCLCSCKFAHITVEGFEEDGNAFSKFGSSQYSLSLS